MAMQRFYDPSGEFISIERLLDHLWEHPVDSSGRRMPLLIWGGAGTGKTAQIRGYAKARGREIMTIHPAHDTDGHDLLGDRMVNEETGELTYKIPPYLPREGGPDSVLFVDELNRAPELVLAGLMELFGEGTISQSGYTLPANCQLVAAANPSELGYQVNELDEAMVDRCLHYAPGWDIAAWTSWATATGQFHPTIIDFMLANPHLISTGEAQLPLEITKKLRCTPRSMTYFNALYEDDLSDGLLRVLTEGIMGRTAGEEFLRKHQGESSLSVQVIYNGGYDPILSRWVQERNDSLLNGSAMKVVSQLVGREVDQKACQRFGRFFALLPSAVRENTFGAMQRSAPAWYAPIEDATHKWRAHLAQRNELFTEA